MKLQNHDAEQKAIGLALTSEQAALDLIGRAPFYYFSDPNHQTIVKHLHRLSENDRPLNLDTLIDALKDAQAVDDAGGLLYVNGLVEDLDATEDVETYLDIIADKYRRRKGEEILREGRQKIYNPQKNTDDVIDEIQGEVLALTDEGIQNRVQQMDEVMDQVVEQAEQAKESDGGVTGIPTGFSKLDEMTAGFQKSEQVILAGRPSCGKTTYACNIAGNIAIDQEIPTAFFSAEVPAAQIGRKIAVPRTGLDYQMFRQGFFNDKDWEKFLEKRKEVENAPIYIDDTPGITVPEIRSKTRKLVRNKGVECVFIDYLQLLSSHLDVGNRARELGKMAKDLKRLARELDISVVCLSQLNRNSEQRGGMLRPRLSDLKSSGDLEQAADVALFIHRPELYDISHHDELDITTDGLAEGLLRKQRNGPVGMFFLRFNKTTVEFEDFEINEQDRAEPEYTDEENDPELPF